MPNERKTVRPPRRRRRARKPGLSPGTIVVDPQAPRPVVRLVGYGPEAIEEREVHDVADIARCRQRHAVTWVHVEGLGDETVLRKIGASFGLHRLALEDVAAVAQRPKFESYGDQHYVVAQLTEWKDDAVRDEQLSLFLGAGYVLTFVEHPGTTFAPIQERLRRATGRIRTSGADYLAYALLDAAVDHVFPVLDKLGDRIEALEEEVLDDADVEQITTMRAVKRNLLRLWRTVWPLREALNAMIRDPTPLVTDETRLHLRDVHDHANQVVDLIEAYRELAAGLLDTHLTLVSNRMNDVMKVLTVIATIFIPLTFVAGIYGMNFDAQSSIWNMPELGWAYGYPACLGLMAVIALGMVMLFRKRRWL